MLLKKRNVRYISLRLFCMCEDLLFSSSFVIKGQFSRLVMQYRLYNILLTIDCHGRSDKGSVCVQPLAIGTQVSPFLPRVRDYFHQS